MTLEQRTDGSLLVRLEHVLQYGEAVTVDIAVCMYKTIQINRIIQSNKSILVCTREK